MEFFTQDEMLVYNTSASQIAHLYEGTVDDLWVLLTTFTIFFMQIGFTMLEAGTVRDKNSLTIIAKNVCDACIGGVVWYLWGYTLQSGGKAIANDSPIFVSWCQSFCWAITTATIVSGGVASRIKTAPYYFFTAVMVGFIYPVAAYCAWDENGILTKLGYLDFAGSGPIHLVGGTAAVVGAKILGPRLGRFGTEGSKSENAMKPHNYGLVVLGALSLWFGWFAFNAAGAGTTFSVEDRAATIAALRSTVLASTAALGTGHVITWKVYKRHSISPTVNAMLGGLVAITGPCAYVDSWEAVVIGVIAACATLATSYVVTNFVIDDPLDAAAVHMANGILGVLSTALFHSSRGLITGNLDSELLTSQFVGMFLLLGWSGSLSVFFFGGVGHFWKMRVSAKEEARGLDFGFETKAVFDAEAIREHTQSKQARARIMSKQGSTRRVSVQ